MTKFRKKPVVIDAVQWRGDNLAEVQSLAKDNSFNQVIDIGAGRLAIPTLEGTMHASFNDWIILGVAGEVYPCKPDIFDATYEEITTDD